MRHPRLARFGIIALLFAAGCSEGVPTESVFSSDPLYAVMDGSHDGIEGFHFLQPMVKAPAFSGTFDGGLSPVVEICASVACDALHTSYSTTEGTGSERVRLVEQDGHYMVNWRTNETGAVPGQMYRVRVVASGVVLGYADVAVVSTGREAVEVRSNGSIALVANQTLPVRFRIETGIVGALVVSPSQATIFNVGRTQQFSAALYDLHGETLVGPEVAWASDDAGVAAIDASGLATGVAGGTATITARSGAAEGNSVVTVFMPDVDPAEHPLGIDGHYLVQSIQTESRDMELVAGRSALFRGFFVRKNPDPFAARLLLRNSGGTVVETIALTPPATIPTGTPDRMDQGTTFQVVVPASLITTGMSYVLEIESAAGILSETIAPRVVTRGSLPVRFVPIRDDATGRVGNVHPGNLDDFLGRSDVLPFTGVRGSVRAEFVISEFTSWGSVLTELWELRRADGSSDLYYGVVPFEEPFGILGIGFVGWPASLGRRMDDLELTQRTFNHEVGHNMGLYHAPCGTPADWDFPFPDGRIGAHGYFEGEVLEPSTPDVMGYCNGDTFGTFHWWKAINYRMPLMAAATGEGFAYRIWGSVEDDEVTLRGPYVGSDLVQGGPPSGPTVQVTVRDENGAILWSGETPLMEFDHAEGGSFSVPVPVSAIGEDRRAMRIDVEAPGLARRGFGVGFDGEVPPGLTRVPQAEIYRAPDGSVVGFGVRGVTRAPEGALIQDGTPRGLIRAPGLAGEDGPVVGRAREMLRGGGE